MSTPPFVPSPRWLSESSGGPPSSGTSHSPWRRVPRTEGDRLLSPVPPPPANLFPDSPDAFNVDPGVPFLATAGPSEGREDHSDMSEESSTKRNIFVGIKNTVRRSLRRQRPTFSSEQLEIRDSGYESPSAPVPSTEAQTSHDYRHDFNAVAELQGRSSLFSGTVTAETASIKYGPDYVKMEPPLDADDSLSAYIKRTKHFFHQLSSLPFSSKTRVTYDHFPERDLRDDSRRRPLMEWHRPGHDPTNYSPPDQSKPSTVPPTPFAEFNHPIPFQPIPIPQQIDHSWDNAIHTRRRKPHSSTPFHRAASIDPQEEWQRYPHYRDGYVPPELAEDHYGSRYGPGIHSERARMSLAHPSSVASRRV